MEYRCVAFVVSVLYSMEEKWRENFDALTRTNQTVNLHRAFYHLHKQGLLGEFSRDFSFDPLYGKCETLENALSLAYSYNLIGMDGTYFYYHLDQILHRALPIFMRQNGFDTEIDRKSVV